MNYQFQHVCFNSKMVRLKGVFGNDQVNRDLSFQFQNGTIKRIRLRLIFIRASAFQFQNGTIKSILQVNMPKRVEMFQFQNGTIKR